MGSYALPKHAVNEHIVLKRELKPGLPRRGTTPSRRF